jgi:hypothetical protein
MYRSVFYTGQSYMDCNHYKEAIQWYTLYIHLIDAWAEERFEAYMRIAKCMMHLDFPTEKIKYHIEKAIEFNKTHKRKKGASTISQQTAKNVFLWPSRSWIRKGLETYFTILIEFFWSKDRIIEVYLNVVELGKGVYGVEAASKKFFYKKAKNLTASESALIAAVLPNPLKFKINKPSPYILKRQQKIMGIEYVEIKFDRGPSPAIVKVISGTIVAASIINLIPLYLTNLPI